MTNAERQRAYRQRQKELGRSKRLTLWLTDDEHFYLERCLEAMREHDAAPALVRKANGTYRRVDI